MNLEQPAACVYVGPVHETGLFRTAFKYKGQISFPQGEISFMKNLRILAQWY